MTKHLRIRTPGKVILSGEHSVVYGYPALVVAINKPVEVETELYEDRVERAFFRELLDQFESLDVVDLLNLLDSRSGYDLASIKVSSSLPIGCGLGSSAALASCLSSLVLILAGEPIEKERVNELAFQLEKRAHQNPSGVDNTIVTFGGVLQYQKVAGAPVMKSLVLQKSLDNFFIVNTGKPQETTGEMVALVKKNKEDGLLSVESDLRKMGELSQRWLEYFQGKEDYKVEELIKENERLLEQIGVVSRRTQALIRQIEANGGVAKISGAGGKKENSGVLLAYHPDSAKFSDFLNKAHLQHFFIELDTDGLVVSEE